MPTAVAFTPLTDPSLRILDRLSHMVWIADIDHWRILWGNRRALTFWSAASLEALAAHEHHASETIRTVHFHIRERLRSEDCVRMEHTIYPAGTPTRMRFAFSAYELPDGRVGLLVEAEPSAVVDPDVVRGYEAVRYAPLTVTTHTLDGATLSANALARRTFGDRFGFAELFEDPAEAEGTLERLRRGEEVSLDVRARTTQGPRWFAMEVRAIPDPVSGADAFLMSAHDVTARREAEQAKDELVSVVSHELRTPLTAIRGALDLLSSGLLVREPETQDEMVHIARENTARLSRLVDDLLDVQRLAAGALVLSREPTDLWELVRRTIELHRPTAQLAGVSLVLEPNARMMVELDAMRIEQVLSNLLSNAVKHSGSGSVVSVEVARSEQRARVTVADQGPGVPASFRERIFGPFAQADGSDARRVGGTGLGLYIAKTLVEQHGGALGYDEQMAQGARFYFELPAEAAALAAM